MQSAITLAVITDNTRLFYVPARWLGEERLRRFLRRFGRFVLVYEADLDKASEHVAL